MRVQPECALAPQLSAAHNMWLVGWVSEHPPQQASNQVRPSLPASPESWMSLLSLLNDLFMSHSEGVSELSKNALAGFA